MSQVGASGACPAAGEADSPGSWEITFLFQKATHKKTEFLELTL